MPPINDDFFMDLALKEAWQYQGLTYPNPAVGCCIVENGRILSLQAHQKAGAPHAEILAIQEAFALLSGDDTILTLSDSNDIHDYIANAPYRHLFKNSTLYTTLEPCSHKGKTPPCAKLIAHLSFERVVIGTLDPHSKGAIEAFEALHIPTTIGVREQEAKALLYPFLQWRKGRFIFFKYASSLNGVIDGGYISDESSLDRVHHLRDKIDLLIIGGATVRADRPTLDARRINGKAPDVLIFSRQKAFDERIPLFNVPDRKVFITDEVERNFLKPYKFIMIEGVGGMMEHFRAWIDYYLIFIAPTLKKGNPINANGIGGDLSLEFLNIHHHNDMTIWACDKSTISR